MAKKTPLIPDDPLQALVDELTAQSALHGVLALTLKKVGGLEFMADWAEENPTQFMGLLMACAPPAAAVDAPKPPLMHPALGATNLDQPALGHDGDT